MESQELLKKYKNKALSAGVVLLTLIIILNIYKGQNQELKRLYEVREAELKKNEVLSALSKSEKKISSFRKVFGKKDSSFVINTLSNIARQSNVKIISINPRGQDNRAAYIRYPFDLIVGAENYHTVGRFVSNIESYGDTFFVERMNMKLAGKTSPDEQQKYGLLVSLTVSTIAYR